MFISTLIKAFKANFEKQAVSQTFLPVKQFVSPAETSCFCGRNNFT